VIKERHLVPGRVLLRSISKRVAVFDRQGRHFKDDWVDAWQPCMVIACYRDVSRRHSRKTAPTEGWEVLVIWYGDIARPIEHVRIPPNHNGWKPAPW